MDAQVESSLKMIAKNAIVVFFAIIIGKIIGLGVKTIAARYLGPDDYGMLSLGFSVTSVIVTLVALGIPQAVLRFIPFYKEKKEQQLSIIPSALSIALPLSILTSIILFIFSKTTAISIFHNEQLVVVFRIFSIMIPFSVMSQIYLSALQGYKRAKESIITSDIILSTVQILSIIILFYAGYRLIGATAAYVFSYIIISIVSLSLLLKNKEIKIFKFDIKISKELLYYSLPLVLSTAAIVIFRYADVLFLSIFRTVKEVGIYSAAFPLAQAIKFISGSIGFLFFPIVTELYAKQKIVEIKQISKIVSRWRTMIAMPLGAFLCGFSYQIIQSLFGVKYVQGAFILIILTIAYTFFSSTESSYELLTAIGQSKRIFTATLIAFSVNFILNILLIPKYGGIGAAIGTLSSLILLVFITTLFVYKQLKFTQFSREMIKPVIAAIGAAIIVYLLTIKLDTNFIILFVRFAIFISIYTFLLILLHSFTHEDIKLIIALRNKFGIKLYWLEKILKRFI